MGVLSVSLFQVRFREGAVVTIMPQKVLLTWCLVEEAHTVTEKLKVYSVVVHGAFLRRRTGNRQLVFSLGRVLCFLVSVLVCGPFVTLVVGLYQK